MSIFTEKEEAFLKELVRLKVQFMLVGLSAATIQGAPVVTQDVDIWFRDLSDQNILRALKKVKGVYVPPFGHNEPTFAGEAVKLFDIVLNMSGLGTFDQEFKHTIVLKLGRAKVPVLNLERIIKSKRAANRQKDRLVLPVLEDALKVVKSRTKLSET